MLTAPCRRHPGHMTMARAVPITLLVVCPLIRMLSIFMKADVVNAASRFDAAASRDR